MPKTADSSRTSSAKIGKTSVGGDRRRAATLCPALGARARDLAHTLVALVVTSAAAGTQVLPDDLWRQAGPIVRGHLSEAGVEQDRLCEVFSEAYRAPLSEAAPSRRSKTTRTTVRVLPQTL